MYVRKHGKRARRKLARLASVRALGEWVSAVRACCR
jgi:hypothetical protein